MNIGLRWLPVFYGATIMLNVFSIIHSAPPSLFLRKIFFENCFFCLVLYFDRIPLWGNFIITLSVGLIVGLCVMIVVKPRLKHSIEGLMKLNS